MSLLQTANSSRSSSSVLSSISFRSWPAENARPAPLMTMARTSGREAWRSSSAVSSSIKWVESALSWSGGLTVTIAAGGASSTSRYFSETAIADLLVLFVQHYSAVVRLAGRHHQDHHTYGPCAGDEPGPQPLPLQDSSDHDHDPGQRHPIAPSPDLGADDDRGVGDHQKNDDRSDDAKLAERAPENRADHAGGRGEDLRVAGEIQERRKEDHRAEDQKDERPGQLALLARRGRALGDHDSQQTEQKRGSTQADSRPQGDRGDDVTMRRRRSPQGRDLLGRHVGSLVGRWRHGWRTWDLHPFGQPRRPARVRSGRRARSSRCGWQGLPRLAVPPVPSIGRDHWRRRHRGC